MVVNPFVFGFVTTLLGLLSIYYLINFGLFICRSICNRLDKDKDIDSDLEFLSKKVQSLEHRVSVLENVSRCLFAQNVILNQTKSDKRKKRGEKQC